ncbi:MULTISPECIES: hypothetical protein, partial [unclassified Rhizobium]
HTSCLHFLVTFDKAIEICSPNGANILDGVSGKCRFIVGYNFEKRFHIHNVLRAFLWCGSVFCFIRVTAGK